MRQKVVRDMAAMIAEPVAVAVRDRN